MNSLGLSVDGTDPLDTDMLNANGMSSLNNG